VTAISRTEPYPNLALCLAVSFGIAFVSVLSLPWAAAAASIMLGMLMISAADVDARTQLLPDICTLGALLLGLAFASILDPGAPWAALAAALARAAGAGLLLASVRFAYERMRKVEGLGLGDVKLAAAGGTWLPLADIPLWLGLASAAALVFVALARRRGEVIERNTRLPFGAFLCPALWLVFYASELNREFIL
jgi:leader peptidase (prepilin peptidase)/N-methyltransferase